MKIYVGNLPWAIDGLALEKLVAEHGSVHSASVAMDGETGRSRGFGFVEMDDDEGRDAVHALNGAEVKSRRLRVSEAPERSPRGGLRPPLRALRAAGRSGPEHP